MRQGPHQKRGRGRGNRRPNTPNRNQTFDSNGPDVRIRGNAHQVYEKYLNLARDASASGDRVLAESYFQHADHYFRIISAFAGNEAERGERNAGNGAQPEVQTRDWSGEDGERQDDRGDQSGEREAQGAREQLEDGDGADRGANGGDRESGRRGRPRRQRDANRDDGRDEPVRVEGPAVSEAATVEPTTGVEVSGEPEAADEDGIRRTLKMPGAPETAEGAGTEPAKPRRRRRAASSDGAAETPVNDDDGAVAAS